MSLKMLMINLFERVLKIFTPNLSGLQAHGHYFFIMRLNKGVTEGPDFPKVGGRRVVQSVGKGLQRVAWGRGVFCWTVPSAAFLRSLD